MGSPNYMSPEQIRDARKVDARADIWALGIILQELMTDAPVFRGESFPGVCAAIVADSPMPVRTMRPDISEKLEAIINRCLEKDARLRFQSVAELAAALSPLGSRATASGSGPQPLVYSSHSRVTAPKAPVTGPVSASASAAPSDGPTLAMPSVQPASRPTPGGTLESARLGTVGGNTHSALSAPDSRVEILQAPRAPRAPSPSLRRWLLPVALLALVVGGVAWLQSRTPASSTIASGEAPASSPPNVPAAPFTLDLESQPPGASVSEGSARLGTTPFSLSLSLAEGASPRVFVLEKEGYEPYVVRQGSARGTVRVVAALSPQAPAPAPAATTPPAPPPPKATVVPLKARHPAPKKSAAVPAAKPPSDIRLER
jgi:serine/threonine-protein kinase